MKTSIKIETSHGGTSDLTLQGDEGATSVVVKHGAVSVRVELGTDRVVVIREHKAFTQTLGVLDTDEG